MFAHYAFEKFQVNALDGWSLAAQPSANDLHETTADSLIGISTIAILKLAADFEA